MKKVKLGEVATEIKENRKEDKTGCRIVGLEHLTPSCVTLKEWSENEENTFTKRFCKGDVLFGRRRAYLKKAVMAPFDGICSGDITVIRAIPDKIDSMLLPFVIQNDKFFDFAVGKSAGSLSPRVKWEHLKQFEFCLPDMEEQHKLADVLWAIHETKEAYRKLIESTDELVKSQFIEMFGNPYDNSKGWLIQPIKDVMRGKVSNGFFAKPADYSEDGNAGIVCVGDVVNRKYSNVSGLRRANATAEDFTRFSLKYGDALFCRSSLVKEGIGKASIIPENAEENILFECHVIRVPLDIERVIPEFFQALTVSDYFREQMINKSKTATMTTIGQKDILSTKIFVPPIDLQCKFKGFSKQADQSKLELQQSIEGVDNLMKAILYSNLESKEG